MRWRALLALAAALLVGGCSGLSGSGPVEPGLDIGSDVPNQVRYVFPGPGEGDSQVSIVDGFLRAGAASDGAYDNARKFLTVKVAESWNPDATLLLQADDVSPRTELVDPAHVKVTTSVAATIDGAGRYTPAPPGTQVSATFELTNVGGQWRISGLPEDFGRWIAQRYVPRLVQPFNVHYVSTNQRDLVPDVRWFPLDKLATRLARAQLNPVPPYLVGAATTAVPRGARLLGDAVSLDSTGLATVNIIATRPGPGEVTRQNLWAQFISTLNQDPTVSQVSLLINGSPVDLVGLDGPAGSLADIGFPVPPPTRLAPPVVRRGAEVKVFDPTGLASQSPQPFGTEGYPKVPPDYTDLALSADGVELAAVSADGNRLSRWRGATRYEVPGFGSQVGAPSYDRRGFLWAGGVGKGTDRLWVVDTSADPADPRTSSATPVRADWLAGRRVLQSRVSDDGDRVAILSTDATGGDARVDLCGVVRADDGRPESLSNPLRLGVTAKDPLGLTWVDDTHVATLAVVGSGPRRPTVLSAGGDVRSLALAPDAVSITTTGGERNLYVITSTGRLLARNNSQWVDNGQADDLAVAAG